MNAGKPLQNDAKLPFLSVPFCRNFYTDDVDRNDKLMQSRQLQSLLLPNMFPTNQSRLETAVHPAYIGKRFILYRNGDKWDRGVVMTISPHTFTSYAGFVNYLNRRQFLRRDPVQIVYTTSGQLIHELDEIVDKHSYVAAHSHFKPVNYGSHSKSQWNICPHTKEKLILDPLGDKDPLNLTLPRIGLGYRSNQFSLDEKYSQSSREDSIAVRQIIEKISQYKKMDLSIVLDGSGSIAKNDFLVAKRFVQNMIETFSSPDRRIGFIVYSDTADVVFSIKDHHGVSEMISRVETLMQPSSGTMTHAALDAALSQFYEAGKSDGICRFLALFTDGVSRYPELVIDKMNSVAKSDIISIAVGLGTETNGNELLVIAQGYPGNVFSLSGFDGLAAYLNDLLGSNTGYR